MFVHRALLSGLFCMAVFAVPQSLAQSPFDRDAALAVSQAAVGRRIGTFTFRDVSGQAFVLRPAGGKPLVVSLIYTSCHHVCPLITTNLAKTVAVAREALGEDAFTVVTIGFDWAEDTPDRMRLFARDRGIDDPDWHFLSGDPASIDALAEDLGFLYQASITGYDHLMQTTIIAGDGRIYRQVYGQDFPATALVEPLKELVFATPPDASFVDHWVDNLLLFCTVYDPNTGRYRFDYSIFMTIAVGGLCLGAVFTFIVREWRRAR